MKFGQVSNPEAIDFKLPKTDSATLALLQKQCAAEPMEVFVGCAKWNKTDLKGFYPRGTKDELSYYARQFNSIELNATFYSAPAKSQVETWRDKTPADFKFFPKVPQSISHYSRLLNSQQKMLEFVDATVMFEEKLGMAFLQMHDNYKPKDFDRLADFLRSVPKGYPLAVEVRNSEWFDNEDIKAKFYQLLEETNTCNVLVDTAGRRDLLHMRLTSDAAFIRYVGANHASDYDRLMEWVQVIKEWKAAGLRKLYFFIHQNLEVESPLLAAHFITQLNQELGLSLTIPNKGTPTLF